jgi:putative ABC transport system permease protein
MLVMTPGAHRFGPSRISTVSQPFEMADVEAIARDIKGLANVAPSAAKSALVVFGSKNHRSSVIGTTPAYFEITNYQLETGRWMNAAEMAAGTPVCIIGETAREALFGSGDPLASAVRIGKMSCTIIGVLAPKGASGFSDPDDIVVTTLRTFQRRMVGNRDVSAVYMAMRPDRSSLLVKQQVELLMRERRHLSMSDEADFAVRDMAEVSAAMASVTGALTALLGGIAAVSLIVGGIGIMNIMLVSVTERTREIGIRLAIGARGRDVLTQFLVEAITLSMVGGVFGVLFGIGLGYMGARRMGLPIVLSPQTVALAFAFSALVGVLFGFLPARRAAQLNPIEALRHE